MRACIGNTSGGFNKDCPLCLAGLPIKKMVQVLERDKHGLPTGRYLMVDETVLNKAIEKKGW